MPDTGPLDAPLPPADRSRILRDSAGVAVATGLYGVSFGAISVASGLSVLQSCALSLLMFTGASQFALVGVVAGGGSAWSGAASAALLGTRNTLYGLRLAPLLQHRGPRRLLAAHLVIDESTAMAATRESRAAARTGFWATGLGIFALWNLATLVGALAGNALGDPRAYGLDAAVGGAFLALLWPRLDSRGHRLVAVLAAAVALGLVPLTAAGVPVLGAAGVALLVGALSAARRPGRTA
ncbi:AzlC family ABC transporter permease [Nocardioides solisilvae]|uniref:AzlC family ABC transporter permease n=1 Tax=Nocardioides solisilvae TaxID=1542435 RepID=UPI000D74495B|nr:AzlC family ABC transporter permease [Nocardioides solisilvae]